MAKLKTGHFPVDLRGDRVSEVSEVPASQKRQGRKKLSKKDVETKALTGGLLSDPVWRFRSRMEKGEVDLSNLPLYLQPKPPELEKPAVLDVRPPAITQNRARLAAYGLEGDSVEELTLAEDAQYQDTLSRRRDLQHAINSTPAGVWAGENQFLQEEEVRRGAALNLLRRGYQTLQIAIATGLEPYEVRALKENP